VVIRGPANFLANRCLGPFAVGSQFPNNGFSHFTGCMSSAQVPRRARSPGHAQQPPHRRAFLRSRSDGVRLPRDELRSKEMDWVPSHHQTILDFTRCANRL
jgi:hypothetical protein